MAGWHYGDGDSEPRICRASPGNCPKVADNPQGNVRHFEDVEEAYMYCEKRTRELYGNSSFSSTIAETGNNKASEMAITLINNYEFVQDSLQELKGNEEFDIYVDDLGPYPDEATEWLKNNYNVRYDSYCDREQIYVSLKDEEKFNSLRSSKNIDEYIDSKFDMDYDVGDPRHAVIVLSDYCDNVEEEQDIIVEHYQKLGYGVEVYDGILQIKVLEDLEEDDDLAGYDTYNNDYY